ncbi:MAG: hypothetical protein ACK5X3_22575 [Pseudomonadota bacterium]
MPQFNFDIARIGHTDQVTKSAGTSIGSSAVRVIVDDINAGSKQEAIRQLTAIRDRMVEDTWPPA